MAVDFWKGPNGSSGRPTSGDFLDAANWSLGAVPGASDDVAFGPGDYVVTLSSASVEVGSISVNQGAELSLVNTSAAAALVLDRASVNYGLISLAGSAIYTQATLTNFGQIDLAVANNRASGFVNGTVSNLGLIGAGSGGYGQFLSAVVNDADGTIRASGGGTVDLSGATTNNGLIEALANSAVTTFAFGILGTVTNLSGNTLTGGHWAANGENATLWLASSTISTLGAGTTVTLAGLDSQVRLDDGSGAPLYLEQTLDTIGAGGMLEVLGGRDWFSSETMTVRGALHLGGGVFSPGDLRAEKGSVVTGFGTIASQAIVDGVLKVDGGRTLEFTTFTDFNGKIGGNGTLALTGGQDTFTTGSVTVKHLLFDGADVQFDHDLKYAGELTVTTGTVELKDSRLSLAGQTTIGAATIQGGPGGVLSVTGELRAHGGTAELDVRAIRVDGVVAVDHGALLVSGAVSGSGAIWIGAQGTLEFEAASRLGAGPLVTMAGPNATLTFDNLASNGARVTAFDGGDRIDFAGVSSTGAKVAWRADADGSGGTLKVSNGGQTATVHLEENHVRADFALKTDAGGGTVVTLAKTAAFGVADTGAFDGDAPAGGHLFAPAHEWHGALVLA